MQTLIGYPQFHGNFYLRQVDVRDVRFLLSDAVTLRFWPDSLHTVKTQLWQLCAPSPVSWSVVVQNFATLFPDVRFVVDARSGAMWSGATMQELMAQMRVLPYRY